MGVPIEELKNGSPEQKRALLAEMLRRKMNRDPLRQGSSGSTTLPRIVPRPEQWHQPFPLTDIQQAYWVGRSMSYAQGDISIHVYSEIDCVDLDLDRLMRAWRCVVERHDMLRAIVLPDGQQQILEQVPAYQFAVQDMRGEDSDSVAAALAALRAELSHQVLRADQWPGFDIRAVLLDGGQTRLFVSIDLLHCDGGSLMILNDEWVRLYHDPEAALPALGLSYRDYVLAGLELQQSAAYRRSQEYWHERAAELPPAPELPVIRNPASLGRTRFVHRSARLEPEVWQQLKASATQLGLTPSTLLLTAYSEVLAAWSQNPEFTINVTLFNRLPMHPQVNQILGDFTSMILLAVDNPIVESFETRARRIQKQLWTDLEHRYMSGVQILRDIARSRGPNAAALMPIVFTSLLDLTGQGFTPPSVSLSKLGTIVYSITQTPQVWLDHQVLEEGGALVLHWDAVEEIFAADLLDDMFAAYCQLLRRLAQEAAAWQDRRRTYLPPAQLAQRAAINATDAPIAGGTLRTIFTAWARQQPDHPAIVTSTRTLTYGTLYDLSNQLGRRLRELGAQPDTLVAIVIPKGWEQVVAVLGIHAAGAAYLPIDPQVPTERLHYLLENGEARIAVTLSSVDARLSWPDCVRRLCLDSDELAQEDASPLEPVQQPQHLSHVIYTSGSTGSPKGVMIEHRSVINRMVDVNQRFGLTPQDRVLALTALHHDLSVYDIFGALMGGTMVIPDAGRATDPAHWAELMVRERVTIWNSVPAFLEMLVEYLEHQQPQPELLPRSLRWAILAGDWIPITLPDRLKALAAAVQVIASGGPTETTIWDIWYPTGKIEPHWKSIPYGKPMANARYYVLNEALDPCPLWAPGHLYIGGAGLARGYLNRPDLTAERFVPNPFARSEDGGWRMEDGGSPSSILHPPSSTRLYKTGDMGRYLPDGNIEFLGREDFQVKIRGYRIELGEIEAALHQHPAVRAAVVNAVGETRGHKRLVAYVVPSVVPSQQPATNGKPLNGAKGAALDEYQDYQIDGVALLDPVERVEFKLEQKGIRREVDRPLVQLIKPEHNAALLDLYDQRRSHRIFAPDPIPLPQFSQLLAGLYQIEMEGLPKYRYASAGGLYPVQTYLYIKPDRVEGIAAGTYYYHPCDHQLLLLAPDARLGRDTQAPNNRAIFDQCAFTIFLIGDLRAITPMYGKRDRDFCLLEAGYMGQLLMTLAEASQIGLCPVGDMQFEQIKHLFALEDSHIYVHALLGGGIAPATSSNGAAAQSAGHQSDTAHNGDLASEVRVFLQGKLPAHMIPTAFIVLDALPLTANGKVNRKALPEPSTAQPESAETVVPPQTDIELSLAAIVQEILEIEQVGVDSNFFDLGGNSVHIVRILNKLRETFRPDISVTDVFRHPTIRLLATYLSQQDAEPSAVAQSEERADMRRSLRARRNTRGHDRRESE